MSRTVFKRVFDKRSVRYRLCSRPVRSSADMSALSQLISERRTPAIIGGNSARAGTEDFSIWAADAKETFTFGSGEREPFEKLQSALNKYRLSEETGDDLPKGMFRCGWIGYFSYELGRYIESIPATAADDLGLGLICLYFYDRAICYDHSEERWWVIALHAEGDSESGEEKLAGLERLLAEAENTAPAQPAEGSIEMVDLSKFRCNMTEGEYFDAIKKIKRYIFDGDVYQINFSQRFEGDYKVPAIDLFHWENEYNPSPYAAYIAGDDLAVVSASPEMFITIRDGVISTKPIKGTRPRLTSGPGAEQINEVNFAELVQSEKEQAELNMIIDLERNDLARICKPGTRRVSQPRTIEVYPTVFHAVATVEGELRDADSPSVFCDVLKAVFPGGSITGAPKIRSMEIIDELEPTQRSVYTGSIGYIGVDGSVCLNIAIRTVIITDSTAYAQTGGGIVADSDPQAEWDETITKARALLAGITAVNKKVLKKWQRHKGSKAQRHKV
jgi:para-aminobenzoate synthetase component 1